MLALYNTKAGIFAVATSATRLFGTSNSVPRFTIFPISMTRFCALDGKTVLEALSQIEPIYRTSVELFYLGEMSYPEIAESLKKFLLERPEPRAARVG